MTALVGIVWAALCLISVYGIYATWGNAQMVATFPEGRRWWMPWARLVALTVFAAVVLINPIWTP